MVYRPDGVRIVKMGDRHRKFLPDRSSVEAKLAAMDATGIEQTALRINAGRQRRRFFPEMVMHVNRLRAMIGGESDEC